MFFLAGIVRRVLLATWWVWKRMGIASSTRDSARRTNISRQYWKPPMIRKMQSTSWNVLEVNGEMARWIIKNNTKVLKMKPWFLQLNLIELALIEFFTIEWFNCDQHRFRYFKCDRLRYGNEPGCPQRSIYSHNERLDRWVFMNSHICSLRHISNS